MRWAVFQSGVVDAVTWGFIGLATTGTDHGAVHKQDAENTSLSPIVDASFFDQPFGNCTDFVVPGAGDTEQREAIPLGV
ncbi:hypothetical protein OCOJLMKI_4142 [Methylobacterium iners]|uniref:Uncharacterized protein n=1 Tax=Methylobacterium iners TaxID=418707 RepID=A0ABQ4S5G4_9HYPH|nr:hypothetical protein OCOJLMKI_4142 [Methylobacterium iners]